MQRKAAPGPHAIDERMRRPVCFRPTQQDVIGRITGSPAVMGQNAR